MSTSDAVRTRLIVPVAMVVLLAWLVSLGYMVVSGRIEALATTTPVMLLLAGYVFGVSISREKRND